MIARRAFTLIEFMVAAAVAVILVAIFIPYFSAYNESSRRIKCAQNLSVIGAALSRYSLENNASFPRVRFDSVRPDQWTAFTGPDASDAFGEASTVAANDVTGSLWLLVSRGYIVDKLDLFVCPSSSDQPDQLFDAQSKPVRAGQRGNFRSPRNLSYGYASPFSSVGAYQLNSDFIVKDFALLADHGPSLSHVGSVPDAWDTPLLKRSRSNSANHGGAGQNVLMGAGNVEWVTTPYIGLRSATDLPGDNIYTAWAPAPQLPANRVHASPGAMGTGIGPNYQQDSYLVPWAQFVTKP